MVRRTLAALAGAAFVACSFANAGSVNVSVDNGVPHVTDEIYQFTVRGDDMVGLEVTAYFDDASSEVAIWGATGVAAGAASGTGWALSLVGDTFVNPWELLNNSGKGMTRLVLNGVPGDVIFDKIYEPFLTENSQRGLEFAVVSGGDDLDIEAIYRNRVAVPPAAPQDDVFAVLDLNFVNQGGLASGARALLYMADTDKAEMRAIPLPAAVWSGMALLGGLGIARRMRKA